MDVCLVGVGAVGQGFLRAVQLRKHLMEKYGLEIRFTGVADSSGALYSRGLDAGKSLNRRRPPAE